MPTVRKLTPTEIAQIEGADHHTFARYNRLVADLAPGEWVEVVLEAGERESTVQMSFTKALRRRGLDVIYSFSDERIYARICEQGEG